MAPVLKRKRDLVDVLESAKRSKAVKKLQDTRPAPKLTHEVGWEAAFNPTTKKELVPTNGAGESGSPEAEDFEEYAEEKREELLDQRDAKIKKLPYVWKLSEPIGGRMLNVDPVFTQDEKFIIVANRTAIQVYSTSNSLLTRSIKLNIDPATRRNAHIITYCLSPTNPEIVWAACSDGAIYSIDWTSGAGADQYWGISSTGCIHMAVASMESAGRRRDVVFTTEPRKDEGYRITANELAPPKGPIQTVARTIYNSDHRVDFLKAGKEGSTIVAASGKSIIIGSLRSTDYGTINKIRYEFRIFESTDDISSLDIKVTDRPKASSAIDKSQKRYPVVDVVVGDVKGTIFVHNDLLQNIARSQRDAAEQSAISLLPRKLHWHRQAVHTVKWSLDGNYVISGGTETVLVLWQLDTGKQQYLPHMSATIQNVVVSPSGSSYGIQLADNSAMVLSVAELKPTANFAGIQARVLDEEKPIDASVRRVHEDAFKTALFQRTRAVASPANPSHLLLGVGQTQRVDPDKALVSGSPFLQTFDLGAGHNISRQALTRANVTNVNITPNARVVSEPRVTHMQISPDGNWLATVDEWMPLGRDLDYVGVEGLDLQTERRRRREVYLKFWQWSKEDETWELVSRIDAPHAATGVVGAGRILDLAADPSSPSFSTIGEDGIVRTWSTRTRKRNGVPVKGKDGKSLRNWICQHAISIGKPELSNATNQPLSNGCVAFSEDGSVLAAACGDYKDNLVHFLDPNAGTIRSSLNGLFEGPVVQMEFLAQSLIIISDRLLVYDLVQDDVHYAIKLGSAVTSQSIEQKVEMVHLAVDPKSRTFAVALPAKRKGWVNRSLLSQHSELAVFDLDRRTPVLVKTFTDLVSALIPTVGSDGYLVLDSTAEIRTILKQGTQAITSLAQSTSALRLDTAEEPAGDLVGLVEDEDEEEVEEADEIQPSTPALDDDDDDETPVVTQQQLSEVFDIGPSFALPPLEAMFYQVAGLFSSKPAQSI